MEDWKKQYRNLMDGHEMPVPEGLWENVSAAASGGSRKTPVFYYLAGAVAATLVAVVLLFAPQKMDSGHSAEFAHSRILPQKSPQIDVLPLPDAPDLLALNMRRPAEKSIPSDIGEPLGDNIPVFTEEEEQQPVESKSEKDETDKTVAISDNEPISYLDFSDPFARTENPGKKRNAIRIGASVSGAALGGSSSSSSPILLSDAVPYGEETDFQEDGENVLEGRELNTEAHHRQLVKAMLSVSIPITERLSFDTGLSYSHHHSDLSNSVGGTTYDCVQELNFIGIPAGLSYTFLQNKSMRLYAGGGAMVEKMIYGSQSIQGSSSSGNRIKADGLQFSLYGGAGAEVQLSPRLGLAFEPGLGYYFPTGDKNLSTIYSDRPLNFELRLALRLHL